MNIFYFNITINFFKNIILIISLKSSYPDFIFFLLQLSFIYLNISSLFYAKYENKDINYKKKKWIVNQ